MHIFSGEAFFKLKQFEEAEKWYQQALKAKTDHIPAHLTYAKLLSKWVSISLDCFDISSKVSIFKKIALYQLERYQNFHNKK